MHAPDCPNRPDVRRNLDEAPARAGVDAEVREREIASPEEAVAAGMSGSPTILVDGVDPFASDAPGSLACRRYPDAGGGGAPSVDALVAPWPRSRGMNGRASVTAAVPEGVRNSVRSTMVPST